MSTRVGTSHKGFRSAVVPFLATMTVILAACGNNQSNVSNNNPLGTLTPGTIQVAIESYMPYSGLDSSGNLTGLDGDILSAAAAKLGYKVSVTVTDFAGTLASVQSHRVDMTLGSVGWTAQRAGGGLFTDPPYYSPITMIEQKGKNLTTIKQFEGKPMGAQTGSLYIDAIKAVPGATLHAYATNAAAISDVVAGRIATYLADPLIGAYAIQQNPTFSSQLENVLLTPPTDAELAAHPNYKYYEPYQTAFYVAPQEAALEKALSAQIDAFYASGQEATIVTKWGADPKQFLTPIPLFSQQRIGVDRPTGWQAPSV